VTELIHISLQIEIYEPQRFIIIEMQNPLLILLVHHLSMGIIINGEEMIHDLLLEVLILDILGQNEISDHVLVDTMYQVHLNGIDYLRCGVNIGDEVFLNVL
jgi:hypothetical protein